MRRAVIDIGTNSVKLLVAEVENGLVEPVLERSCQTRLGEGFYPAHQLQPGPIVQTVGAVARFVEEARALHAGAIRVIGTSAAREAVNCPELSAQVLHACGLPLQVISGELEAEWAFAGVRTDPSLNSHPLLLVDVGGGSTEFIVGDAGVPTFRRSFSLGTVRLLEQIKPSDPPQSAEWSACREQILALLDGAVKPVLAPQLERAGRGHLTFVGTGGTTTILAAMEAQLNHFDRERIEQVVLSREAVWGYQKRLWSEPLASRQKIVGLPPNRADVILFGTAIFALMMETFALEWVRPSTRGLRFAAVC